MKKHVMWLLLIALVLTPHASAQSSTTPPWREPLDSVRETVELTVGEHVLLTELVFTGRQQSLGLGYRNSLEWDSAMLFVNESPAPRSFWMKGMRFCLDIIWIENGEIVGAAENTCPDPEGTPDAEKLRVSSPVPVTYVLEVNAGWLAANGYGVGTPVTIPDLPQG